MSEPLVLIEIHADSYAVLTLNRPLAMNALSRALMDALAEGIATLSIDPAVRVLILTGAGRAFCAGLDLKEIGAGRGSLAGTDNKPHGPDPLAALMGFAGPVIAAINGAAVTGGFEIALACDVILASSAARFADTHARIGVAPGWGLSQRLSRAIGPYRARELSLTGNWLSAELAAAWGLVNRVLAPDDLLPAARALACDMLSTDPALLLRYKSVINDGFALALGEGLALERERARAFNAGIRADEVEQRREAVRARNRSAA